MSNFHQILNATHQWSRTHHAGTQLLSTDNTNLINIPFIISAILSFAAAAISSAGGTGGGGLFIPILKIVAGLDLKLASTFSSFMVTGGSIANVACYMLAKGGAGLVDFDVALIFQPCMLLGVSVGVVCNRVLPEWLITAFFAVFLGFSTFKTCKSGVRCWKTETERGSRRNINGWVKMENGEEPLLSDEGKLVKGMPWMKVGMLVVIWFSFSAVYLLRGNSYGQENGGEKTGQSSCKLMLPLMAFLAGALGGLFGVGGGMLISPLLLQLGKEPEVTAATCSFMVFFSSTMSAVQYLLLGMEHISICTAHPFRPSGEPVYGVQPEPREPFYEAQEAKNTISFFPVLKSMEYEGSYQKMAEPKIECLLFDVDDTLYPLSSGISAECTKNIIEYMINKLGIEEDKVPVMCAQLYKEYGTTMAGLQAIGYDFDYDDYHSFVHGRLPYDWLKPDHTLRSLLHSLPIRKVIFSNGNEAHVAKVLSRLGLEDCFDDIICFETLNPTRKDNDELPKPPIVCKPFENSFEQAFKIAGINPQKTVGSSHRTKGVDYALESIHNMREALPELWEALEKSDVRYSGKPAIETYVKA
ncbi:hypothetical protein DH2020_005216 [Rehmannia glutinosa]|uniref:Sulfite exporter TauE/SafE family protein n=1 Tax=Rehmannia glutinosa TaxID=99300 RepID=A0ABR0W3B6_REHGL